LTYSKRGTFEDENLEDKYSWAAGTLRKRGAA